MAKQRALASPARSLQRRAAIARRGAGAQHGAVAPMATERLSHRAEALDDMMGVVS